MKILKLTSKIFLFLSIIDALIIFFSKTEGSLTPHFALFAFLIFTYFLLSFIYDYLYKKQISKK